MYVYVKKFVLRFISLTRNDSTLVDWTMTAEDIEGAEMDWVIDCQRHIIREVQLDMWKHQLDLFLDHHKVYMEMWREIEQCRHLLLQ